MPFRKGHYYIYPGDMEAAVTLFFQVVTIYHCDLFDSHNKNNLYSNNRFLLTSHLIYLIQFHLFSLAYTFFLN